MILLIHVCYLIWINYLLLSDNEGVFISALFMLSVLDETVNYECTCYK